MKKFWEKIPWTSVALIAGLIALVASFKARVPQGAPRRRRRWPWVALAAGGVVVVLRSSAPTLVAGAFDALARLPLAAHSSERRSSELLLKRANDLP